MPNNSDHFSVKSAYELLIKRRLQQEWLDNIWLKDIPFKISCFPWRVWQGRIVTEDNLRKMTISLASRCYCCECYVQKTMFHLFLTTSLDQKLCIQLIQRQWNEPSLTKLRYIYKAILSLLMWELWKKGHDNEVGCRYLLQQTMIYMHWLVKIKIPMNWGTNRVEEIIAKLQKYKPKNH